MNILNSNLYLKIKLNSTFKNDKNENITFSLSIKYFKQI